MNKKFTYLKSLSYPKVNKFSFPNVRMGFIFLAVSFFVISPHYVLATIFQPGQTLEPDCAPGSVNCGVAIFSLNGQTNTTQTLVTGVSGTDFNIASALNIHSFNIPSASAIARGLLTAADWLTFNSKQDTLVSGTNIKTVGGISLLGSGDIPVSGTGTVTSVSVVTANGVSGTVATATTTPAITLSLGAIVPTTVNGVALSGSSSPSLAVTGATSVSGTNTGDQTTITGNAGTATALQTARTINGVSFDGTANVTVTSAAGTLTGATLNPLVVTSSLTAVGALSSGSIAAGFGTIATANTISTSNNISTTGTGTITSAGLLTASNGLTQTTGALNLTATSGALTLSGLSASSISTGGNALTITSSNFNTTATGINTTAIGATTASTGAFTTLTSNNTTNIGNGSGIITSIGNSGGVAALNLTSGTGSQTFTSSVATGTGATSAFVFNASALSSGTGLRLTSTSTSGLLFDQNATNTSGTINKLAYGAGTTLSGTTTGLNLDLNTNVTANGVTLTGASLSTSADTNINTATKKGLDITSGAITQNTAAATGTYIGADVTVPALTLTSGTALNGYGIRVTTDGITQTAGALTSNGLLVDSTGSTITTGGTINGVKINAPTTIPSVGTYNSLFLGTSTGATANTVDQANITVGNIASTATQNFSTLNIQNGGTGFLDVELVRGMLNFRDMNTLYDDFTGITVDQTKWSPAVLGGNSAANCISGATTPLLAAGLNGIFRMITNTTVNRGCRLSTQPTLSDGFYQRGNNPIFETKLRTSVVAATRIFAGFSSAAIVNTSDTNASTHHAYIAKKAADTAWQCVTDDGGATETTTSTGVTIVANTFYRLRVEVRNGTTPETICTVDDGTTITRTVVTATQPGATSAMDVYIHAVTSDTTSKNIDIDYVRAWQDDPPVNQQSDMADGMSKSNIKSDILSRMSIRQFAALVGDVSPDASDEGLDNGLSTLVATIQAETANNPITIISQKITDGKQFLTDFVAARITAIRGYFDEVFTKKVHTEELCVKKSDGNEVCATGDQLNSLLQNSNVSVPAPAPLPSAENTPPSSDTGPSTTSDPAPAPDPTSNPEATPSPETVPVPDAAPAPVPVQP